MYIFTVIYIFIYVYMYMYMYMTVDIAIYLYRYLQHRCISRVYDRACGRLRRVVDWRYIKVHIYLCL